MEIVRVSHVVVPRFLLELGRRRQHIEIEFPADPCDSAARFGPRVGPSYSIYSISSEQLIRLVAEAGEEWSVFAISETSRAGKRFRHA